MAIKVQENDTIEDIINKSVQDYQIVKKIKRPQFMETLINDPNSNWEDGGYNYNTFEFTIFNRKNYSILNVNMQTNIITIRYKDIYKFYDPIKNEFVEFTPEANKEFNLRTRKWEYFNRDTGEWTDRISKKEAQNVSGTVKMYYSIKNKAFIYFDNNGKTAIYRPDAGIWGFNNGKGEETKYFNISDGKRIVIDKTIGRFVYAKPKAKYVEEKNEEPKKIESTQQVQDIIEDYEKQEFIDFEKEQRIEENSERMNFLNSLGNIETNNKSLVKQTKVMNLINWFRDKREKIASFFSRNSKQASYYKENLKRNMHLLFDKQPVADIEEYKKEPPKQEIVYEKNKSGKLVYRSQETRNRLINKKLKLAKIKAGLKFKDPKRSIMYLAGAAIVLGGSLAGTFKFVNALNNNFQNNKDKDNIVSIDAPINNLSINQNTAGINGDIAFESTEKYLKEQNDKKENQEHDESKADKSEITNLTSTTVNKINYSNSDTYIVKAGTQYTEKSTNEGKRGKFDKDTVVGIYNRAIVKKDANGKMTTVLSTNGMSWKDFSKKSGIPIEQINAMLISNEYKEMVAVFKDKKTKQNTFGWVGVSQLKENIQENDIQER